MTIAMLGRTGCGKTTLAVKLATNLGMELVESAAIKEELGMVDCLSEDVRDLSYSLMIGRAENAVLDASFHRRERREWLYKAVESVVFVYCDCSDKFEVVRRIAARRGVMGARAHADDVAVYEQIDSAFEEPEAWEFTVPVAMVRVDTFNGTVGAWEYYNGFSEDVTEVGAVIAENYMMV